MFGFENDGICSPGEGPLPPGCVILSYNSSKEVPTLNKPGEPCPSAFTNECGYPEPAGEPKGITFPEGISINGYGKNENPITGYEGPSSWFTGIGPFGSFPHGSGVVNFSPAIPPGGSTYFSLESPPVGGFGSSSSLTTALSATTVTQGTPVTDTATLGGAAGTTATGPVGFNVYSDASCTKLVAAAGTAKLAGGKAGPSSPETLAVGTYYWQAHYSGSLTAQSATSECGSEVLTVQAPTTTATTLTGGGETGASIPVLLGTSVTDQAKISGSQAASAAGSVTYTVFSDSKCTKALGSSLGSVIAGTATPSAPFKAKKTGTYYFTASYSGGGLNAPSSSACGAEKLIVSVKTALGLPNGKKCFSKRKFAIHPHFPKGAKITSYEEFVNGSLVKQGHLSNHATSVNLIGLPKGTYKVALVTFTSSGNSYEDTRTFHTCVKKKHKKH
jgi:hypothetical protein